MGDAFAIALREGIAILQPLFADRALAARIESSVVRDLQGYAEACLELEPSLPVAQARIAGGLALYVAPGSPVNMVFGAGLDEPATAADVEAIEHFYAERGAAAAISLSPLSDEGLVSALGLRGWRITDFESVLVRPLDEDATPPRAPDPRIAVTEACTSQERFEWAALSSSAFDAPDRPVPEAVRLGEAMAARRDVTLLLASLEDRPVGAGALWIDGDLAWILGDATLPEARRQGVQSALLAERIRRAREAGAQIVVSEARPGSTSQRNHERLGFSVVYTRVELIRPLAPSRGV